MPVPIAIVRNEGTVGSNVMAELPNGLVQLQAIFESSATHFEILFQEVRHLQCAADITMPQVPLQSFQSLRKINSVDLLAGFIAVRP